MKTRKSIPMKAVLISFLIPFLVAPAAMAYTIGTGPSFGTYYDSTWEVGEFTVKPINDSSKWTPILNTYSSSTKSVGGSGTFQTFCLEYNEFIYENTTYTASFNNKAINGGVGPDGDPISSGTAWLYHQFQSGILTGYNYSGAENTIFATRERAAGALQEAIWWLEGELDYNPTDNDFITLVKQLSNYMDDNNGYYPVSVLNLYDGGEHAQDLLVCDPVSAPEPATMLLLGSGLIGLAGLARKRFRKQ